MKTSRTKRERDDAFWTHYYSVVVPEVHAKLDIVAAKAKIWWKENHPSRSDCRKPSMKPVAS